MRCRCGAKIQGTYKYSDYCRECNKAIIEYLEELEKIKKSENKNERN